MWRGLIFTYPFWRTGSSARQSENTAVFLSRHQKQEQVVKEREERRKRPTQNGMPTLQGWRSGPPEVPINRLKTGSQTIAARIKANIRGIISQGPAVLLMAQPPIAACLVAARIYFFFVFSELPVCFFALQCFHSDLHLELLFFSPPITLTPRPHGAMLPHPAQPSPCWLSTLGHWLTAWSHQMGNGDRGTCSYYQGCIGNNVLLETQNGNMNSFSQIHSDQTVSIGTL